jgi:hypothetical protein
MAQQRASADEGDWPLTAWIDGSTTPVRPGVYERRSPAGAYACWSGRHWYADADTPAAAATRIGLSAHSALPWRGVATPTPGACFQCRGHTVVDGGFDPDTDADLIDECPEC